MCFTRAQTPMKQPGNSILLLSHAALCALSFHSFCIHMSTPYFPPAFFILYISWNWHEETERKPCVLWEIECCCTQCSLVHNKYLGWPSVGKVCVFCFFSSVLIMAAPQSILLSALPASPSWDEEVDYMSEERLGFPGARTEEMQTEESLHDAMTAEKSEIWF